MTVTVTIPMALPSAGNMREHPMARHRRIKAQRQAVSINFMLDATDAKLGEAVVGHRPAEHYHGTVRFLRSPLAVTLTRIAPRKLDDDNLAFAFKGIRDEVAAYFGVDDADPRLTWRYAQERGKACVRIEFDVVTAESDIDVMRRWFEESGNAEFWRNVPCIECELGRTCLKSPPCAGAEVEP